MSDSDKVPQYDEDLKPRSIDDLEENEGKSPFSKMSRILSEEDLTSPITARFLLNQFDDYQILKCKHEKLQIDFYEKDKLCSVYEVKNARSTAFEVLSSAMLSIGPLLLGTLSHLIPTYGWEFGTIVVLVAGILLLLGGVIAKIFAK